MGQTVLGLTVALLMVAQPAGTAQAHPGAAVRVQQQVTAPAAQGLLVSSRHTPKIDVVRVGRAINAVRARSGLKPLRYISGGCQSSTAYSVMRRGRLKHLGCDNIQARIRNWNQLAPAWRGSAGHRRLIKAAKGTARVGVARDRRGNTFISVSFGR